MPIPLIVAIVGGVVAIIASRPKLADGMIADLGKWAFAIGLAFTLYGLK